MPRLKAASLLQACNIPLNWKPSSLFSLCINCRRVGLIESLLTLNIIDEIQTRGRGNKEAVAQGTKYISGLLSGMGGCAMIGQSLINISAGARAGFLEL